MKNIHDLARKYLATDGLKIRDTQKAGVFLFADWLAEKEFTVKPAELVNPPIDRWQKDSRYECSCLSANESPSGKFELCEVCRLDEEEENENPPSLLP